ncbi:DUF4468 domain-containing protein [Chryseobacterium sp. JV274]|uniref:DUF4468 domain-containing protein n=1 Tax=Chryseobacterium sp. JV274 TaxID=1932669 RepID=UPI000986E381|nr:DUF4468 domain-containing protein [Chryseobacterium sp. JV274]
MKQILIFSFFIISSAFHGQDLKFEETIIVDSIASKSELFNRARSWVSQNFHDNNNKITVEDSNVGEISGVGLYDYRATKNYLGFSCVEGPLTYMFSIFLKDGKYKYVFHSFIHNGSGGPGCRRIDYGNLTLSEKAPAKGKMIADDYAWWDIKEKIKAKIQELASQLKIAMAKKHETSNNW